MSTLRILTTLLISLMMASSAIGTAITYGDTFPASGGTTILTAYPLMFDTSMFDVLWESTGGNNANLRIVKETPVPFIAQFTNLILSDLLFWNNPTIVSVTNIVTPVSGDAALGFDADEFRIGVAYVTTANTVAFGTFNVGVNPMTVQTAFANVGGVIVQPTHARVTFDAFTNIFKVYAISQATSGLFFATYSLAGVQITPWTSVNAGGFLFTMFAVPDLVGAAYAGQVPIIAASTAQSSTIIARATNVLAGTTQIDTVGADAVATDPIAANTVINFNVYQPRGSNNIVASETNPTAATVTQAVTVNFGSPPDDVGIAGAAGGAAGENEAVIFLNEGGTTQTVNINFGAGTATAAVNAPVNINFGAGNVNIGGVTIATSGNGGSKATGTTNGGGGATLGVIGIGTIIGLGPQTGGADAGKIGGGQGGGAGGAGGGGAGAGGGGAGANPGGNAAGGFIPPFDFMPTGYGFSAAAPWDSTNLYFAPCSTLTTAVRNFLDTLYRGTTTGTDLPYQNSAAFTTAARLRSPTQIASVEYRECATGTAQLLSLANVFPQDQTVGSFIGVFSAPSFSGNYQLIPVSYGVDADKAECTDTLTFKDSAGTVRHIGYVDTTEGVTVRVLSDPPAPFRVRLLDSAATVVYDSSVDTPPSTELDVTVGIITGFVNTDNVAAQFTPVHGASYDFLNWNFVDTATEFRVEAPDNGVKTAAYLAAPTGDAVCGMRLVHTPKANKFAHQISRTPSSAGNTMPYGTTNNQITTLADFNEDPFGVFAEQRITTPVQMLFANGFDMGVEDVSSTPEFSPTTLLLAVLLGGMFVMFVVRRRKQ